MLRGSAGGFSLLTSLFSLISVSNLPVFCSSQELLSYIIYPLRQNVQYHTTLVMMLDGHFLREPYDANEFHSTCQL